MTESQVRKLRDEVYGSACADSSWDSMKANWMRPDSIEWLKERAKIKLPDRVPKKQTQRIY